MKFMLIVHHDEEAFNNIKKEKRQQVSGARIGTVEVRPLIEITGLPG